MRLLSQGFGRFHRPFRLFLSLTGDTGVHSMRRFAMIALMLWSGGLQAAEWMPLHEALTAARSNGHLILLHLRGDDRADAEWIAHVDSNEALQRALRDVILAAEKPVAARAILADLADFRPRRSPLVLLDPGGGLLAEMQMKDYGAFALTLAEFNRMGRVFAASARARVEGRVTEALLLRANGLLYSGLGSWDLFMRVIDLARSEGNDAIVQEAELGLAAIASGSRRHHEAIKRYTRVAEKPVTPDLGARAWIQIGHERKNLKDTRGAIEAYQKAYRLTPPPSPNADDARRFLEMIGSAPEEEVKAAVATGAVRLLYPRHPVLAGNVAVSAAAPANAARVEFYLDDARVAEAVRAPFAATIPLGAVPRVHTIKAAAFDAAGAFLGQDAATINERSEALGVEIVAPRDSIVESKTVVEVQPHLPDGIRLEAIDLYWNDRKLATLTAPPFRYELTLPAQRAFGYIRAVARDSSGATAEDAKLINSEGGAEIVQVDAVELQTIVQDAAGRIVEGLRAADFEVKEDGVRVEVAAHNSANDPITVGLALDVSGSMRVAMASVMEYATEFLRHSLTSGDQTFIVSFADAPTLVQPLTADLANVSASILDMRAQGRTALWDAVVFALGQLRTVPGKRALLLFTDGIDSGSRTSAAAALQFAQEIGVPVYAVLVYTGSGTTFRVPADYGTVQRRSASQFEYDVKKIAAGTGGAFVRFPRQQDLPRLFQQVRDDTRGAYALTFVSKSKKKRSELRKVVVAVPSRKGVVVRAPSAYYPR
jgi:Ca-activated chloride channel homolog